MSLVDKDHFFHKDEVMAYNAMLKEHGLMPKDFDVIVTEDQEAMDMEDLNYVVILHVKVSHSPSGVSKTYSSTQNSGLWIKEVAEDISNGVFG